MIEIRHLKKAYGDVVPIRDANAVIEDGEVISIIGPSGTGKSTLLRMINLMELPTGGQILVDGEDITVPGYDATKVRKKIGMVFQNFNLYPHLSVIENIMVPQIHILGRSKQEAYDKAVKLLKAIGLYQKCLNFPDELSGGQKQRVAIARTLAMDTDVILFDEPTSALDPSMVGEVETVIQELAKTGRTLLIVTHDMDLARNISKRVFYMDQGLIYEDGTAEQIFESPQKELTDMFVNRIRKLEFELDSKYIDFLDCMSQIEIFGQRNKLEHKTVDRIKSVFEELVIVDLLPRMQEGIAARVYISYIGRRGELTMDVFFGGEKYDLLMNGDEIADIIIRNNSSDIKVEYNVEQEMANHILIDF